MKIVGLCLLRNEADIVEVFIRYHLQIFDHLIIMNHRSTDSTREILENLQMEGLPLDVLEETSIEYQQSKFMTRLLKKAVHRYNPDWVIPVDVDEFIGSPQQATVRQVLEQLPNDKIIKLYYRSYVPFPSDNFEDPNILTRIQHRRIWENPQLGKILIPRVAIKKGAIAPGNHGFIKLKFGKQKEFPFIHTDKLFFAHFPVRSNEQIMVKAFATWLSILAKPNKEQTEGLHIKLLFDRFAHNGQIEPHELSNMAINYVLSDRPETLNSHILVCDPLRMEKGNINLRYNTSYTSNPVQVIARMAEDLAEALASARNESGRHSKKSCFNKVLRSRTTPGS